MAKIKPGGRGASSTPASPVQEDDGSDNGSAQVDGTLGADVLAFQRAAVEAYYQTTIEVPEKVGLPPRIRTMKHDVEYNRDKGNGTMVVGVEDMERVFEWMGYPLDAKKVRL